MKGKARGKCAMHRAHPGQAAAVDLLLPFDTRCAFHLRSRTHHRVHGVELRLARTPRQERRPKAKPLIEIGATASSGCASCRFERDDSYGTPGTAYDFQRCSNHDRTRYRKQIKVGQAGQTEFSMAVHDEMIAERWIKASSLSGIGTDSFNAHAENV